MNEMFLNIFKTEEKVNMYQNNVHSAIKLLGECANLHQINNIFELDKSIDKTHEAKTYIDVSLSMIEREYAYFVNDLKGTKEDLKLIKIKSDIAFDSKNQQLKEDCTVDQYKKRKELTMINVMKNEQCNIRSYEDSIEIIKMELKYLERIRENISELYMSYKKKYDFYTKFAVV